MPTIAEKRRNRNQALWWAASSAVSSFCFWLFEGQIKLVHGPCHGNDGQDRLWFEDTLARSLGIMHDLCAPFFYATRRPRILGAILLTG